jgi:hypothetical protein
MGVWVVAPTPKPKSPIPNPQSPIPNKMKFIIKLKIKIFYINFNK